MKIYRQGQGAAPAALVAIIAAMIILYIIAIPPAERSQILEGDGTTGGSEGTASATLLTERPGKLDFLSQTTIEHPLPAVRVFTKTEGAVLQRSNFLEVRRSLFSSRSENFSFTIDDLANTNNILLSLQAEGVGALTITLNGQTIFSDTATTLRPLELRKDQLETSNVITFSVSSPGAAFWRTNRYTLRNIQISGDVTSLTAQRARSTFIITQTELSNIERATLRFAPECEYESTGPLRVSINGIQIYSSVPDCGNRLPLEFSPTLLRVGENDIEFSVQQGEYYLGFLNILTELARVDYPLYFFDIDEQQFRDIRDGASDVTAKLRFTDYSKEKRGELIINGDTVSFDVDSLEFEKDISSNIVLGSNSLKISPRKTLEISELTVTIERGEGVQRSGLELPTTDEHRITLASVLEDNCRSSSADTRLRFSVSERNDLDSFTIQFRRDADDNFDSITIQEDDFKREGDDDTENSRSGDTYTYFHRNIDLREWEYRVKANYANGKDPVSASKTVDLDALCS